MKRASRGRGRGKAAEEILVRPSSGNVFEDLGVPDGAAALAKAELAARIGELIADRGLTQAQAASLLGVDQPSVSALLRGRLRGFSSDRLFRFLNALGSDVLISIRARPRSSTKPAIRVVRRKLAG